MFDTFNTSVSFNKVSSASEMHKSLHTKMNSDFIPCRGLPATWSDPIVELPQRTRGLQFHLWTEKLPTQATQTVAANDKPRVPEAQKPVGTLSALAENVSYDNTNCGYIPWAHLKAVRAGTLKLKDALPATARELKTEAWLELADTFVAMSDHETAGVCIQNALATSAARRGMAGSYFPPVPAVLPPLMPCTEALDDSEASPAESCLATSVANSEDWALIEHPAESPMSPSIMVEREDVLLVEEEKPVVRLPRPQRFIFGVVSSALERLVR